MESVDLAPEGRKGRGRGRVREERRGWQGRVHHT